MGFTALHILWLVPAFTLTTQELVELSVSPKITAECGKQVTLQCKVSSFPKGLLIRHMEWSHDKMSLCFVNSAGNITHNRSALSDFHCEYRKGQLSLIFKKMQPLESENSPYRCKLQSNMGARHKYTPVELQECCGIAEGVSTTNGPACTFNDVYPDGDVHWFHGSQNLSDESMKHHTTKRVEAGGWLTIISYLKWKRSDVSYNCSLKSTKSGRYIASILVENAKAHAVRSQGPMGTILCISILLAVTLK
ncbi:uncharacterized protein LOC120800497 isoform X2 [Xiphias gladius]|uniref:uncharacterized protein LOC120800497 isoform X1 n=1 Tax=Xiphias gladius TaxID=8245 RepID=UPI001A99AF44|nr:uncharacterized protein LOC120800497 isoform X1 [Xiphias gladius]XP_040002574.1 uncharacterized protein LOC120800497 isoform X2 [Xiphias gladius]